MRTPYTPGPWAAYRLAPDEATYGDQADKHIITARNHEIEICGIVHRDEDAELIARVPELMRVAGQVIQRFDELLSRWDSGNREVENEIAEVSSAISRLESLRNGAIGMNSEST